MRNNLAILFLCVFISCKTKLTPKSTLETKNITDCKIYKIDSISDYYLVYAIDNKFRYKIVSRKDYKKSLPKIKVNSNYKFELKEVINLDSISHKYVNYLDFKRCHKFFPLIEICNEPGIELYQTNNLVGLYYKE